MTGHNHGHTNHSMSGTMTPTMHGSHGHGGHSTSGHGMNMNGGHGMNMNGGHDMNMSGSHSMSHQVSKVRQNNWQLLNDNLIAKMRKAGAGLSPCWGHTQELNILCWIPARHGNTRFLNSVLPSHISGTTTRINFTISLGTYPACLLSLNLSCPIQSNKWLARLKSHFSPQVMIKSCRIFSFCYSASRCIFVNFHLMIYRV